MSINFIYEICLNLLCENIINFILGGKIMKEPDIEGSEFSRENNY